MAAKLTNEQRDQIAANPHQAVPVVDEQSGKTYYVVDDEFLFGADEASTAARERLVRLIEEGERSGEVSEADAHAHMNATIDKFRDKTR